MNMIKAKLTPEKLIQSACLDYLSMLERQGKLYFFRSQAGAVHTVRGNGSKGFFKTGRPGAPDITVCYKGKFVGLEIKNEKGKQSAYQEQAQKQIESTGGYYFIIRSLDELVKLLNCL